MQMYLVVYAEIIVSFRIIDGGVKKNFENDFEISRFCFISILLPAWMPLNSCHRFKNARVVILELWLSK